jgi:hypothetical protein
LATLGCNYDDGSDSESIRGSRVRGSVAVVCRYPHGWYHPGCVALGRRRALIRVVARKAPVARCRIADERLDVSPQPTELRDDPLSLDGKPL